MRFFCECSPVFVNVSFFLAGCYFPFSMLPKQQRVIPYCTNFLNIINKREMLITNLFCIGWWGTAERVANDHHIEWCAPIKAKLYQFYLSLTQFSSKKLCSSSNILRTPHKHETRSVWQHETRSIWQGRKMEVTITMHNLCGEPAAPFIIIISKSSALHKI